MNRQVGNDHEIAVDIHKSGLDPLLRPYDHSSRDGERPVEPGGAQHAAVFLDVELHILLVRRDLRIRLDLEDRRIAVTCHHLKSRIVRSGNTESDDRGVISGDIVPFARLKLPRRALIQTLHAGLLQDAAHIPDGIKGIGTMIKK